MVIRSLIPPLFSFLFLRCLDFEGDPGAGKQVYFNLAKHGELQIMSFHCSTCHQLITRPSTNTRWHHLTVCHVQSSISVCLSPLDLALSLIMKQCDVTNDVTGVARASSHCMDYMSHLCNCVSKQTVLIMKSHACLRQFLNTAG